MTVPRPTRRPTQRFRSRERRQIVGGWEISESRRHAYAPPHSFTIQPRVVFQQEMKDWITKQVRPDGTISPSDLDMFTRQGVMMSASGKSGDFILDNYVDTVHTAGNFPMPESWESRDQGNDIYVTNLLANTSPFRSTLSLPVLIAEALEMSTLLKFSVKRGLVQGSGAAYLNLRFGWQTLIRDLQTLNKAVELIESRVKEFDSLFRRGGLRRKVNLDRYTLTPYTDDRVVSNSAFHFARGTITETYTCKVWGSIRWRPKAGMEYKKKEFKEAYFAFKQVFDLEEPDLETVWEAIPFSWLIDYFTGISDLLKSYDGREWIEPYDICIMRERTSSVTVKVTSNTGVTVTPIGDAKSVRKLRTVIYEEPPLLARLSIQYPNWSQAKAIIALLAASSGKWK